MKILTVASGKGGVGKTTLTANMGVALASTGKRVVLVDADLGLANLDVVLGVKAEVTLHHVVEGLVPMRDALTPGPGGVRVLAGSSGVGSLLRLSRRRLELTLAQTAELAETTDVLIFDAASGADPRVMAFLQAAEEAVLVTTPDPTSIVDCYSTAKVLLRCKKDAIISVAVNRVDEGKQARKTFETITSATQKFLGRQLHYLGYVREDRAAAEIASLRRPFVITNPGLPASADVRNLAAALLEERYPCDAGIGVGMSGK